MCTDKMKSYEELLNLLAEEQSPPKDVLTAKDVERCEYRRERIRKLMSRLGSIDEAQSR